MMNTDEGFNPLMLISMVLLAGRITLSSANEPITLAPSLSPASYLALLGYEKNSTGLLHVYHGGVWYPVCTAKWDEHALRVLCVSFGYQSYIEEENRPTHIEIQSNRSNIKYQTAASCKGTESDLSQCTGHKWIQVQNASDCYKTADKLIHCDTKVTTVQNVKEVITSKSTTPIPTPASTLPSTSASTVLLSTSGMPPTITPTAKRVLSNTFQTPGSSNSSSSQSTLALPHIQKTSVTTKKSSTKATPVATVSASTLANLEPTTTVKYDKYLYFKESDLIPPTTSSMETVTEAHLDEDKSAASVNSNNTLSDVENYPSEDETVDVYEKSDDIASYQNDDEDELEQPLKVEEESAHSQRVETPPPSSPSPTEKTTKMYMITPSRNLNHSKHPNHSKTDTSGLAKDELPQSLLSELSSDPDKTANKASTMTTKPTVTTHKHETKPTRPHVPHSREMRPGFPWNRHPIPYPTHRQRTSVLFPKLKDIETHMEETNKLHPRFLDAKYDFASKDCPGYKDTFVGTREEGQITSPSYPAKYPGNVHCVWRIHVHPSQHIRLEVMDFITEEGDVLKIYENYNLAGNPHLVKTMKGNVLDLEQLLHDRNNKTIVIKTDKSVVYLEFNSNAHGTARGFLVEYKAFPTHIPRLSQLLVGENVQFVQTVVGVVAAMIIGFLLVGLAICKLKFKRSKSELRRRLYQEAVSELHRDYETMSNKSLPMHQPDEVASLSVSDKDPDFSKSVLHLGTPKGTPNRNVAYKNPAYSQETSPTSNMSSVFMEAGKYDDSEKLDWGNDDEEETSVIFSIFSRKNKKKKKKSVANPANDRTHSQTLNENFERSSEDLTNSPPNGMVHDVNMPVKNPHSDFDKMNTVILGNQNDTPNKVPDLLDTHKISDGQAKSVKESKEQAGFGSIQSVIAQVHTNSEDEQTMRTTERESASNNKNGKGEHKSKTESFSKKIKRKMQVLKSTRINGTIEEDEQNLIQLESPCKQNGHANPVEDKALSDTSISTMHISGKPSTDGGPAGLDMIGRVTSEMISPREFICPITTKIMKQPMAAPDGYVYERNAIKEWIENHGRSPISGMSMTLDEIQPCPITLAKIRDWKMKRKQQRLKMESDKKIVSNQTSQKC